VGDSPADINAPHVFATRSEELEHVLSKFPASSRCIISSLSSALWPHRKEVLIGRRPVVVENAKAEFSDVGLDLENVH